MLCRPLDIGRLCQIEATGFRHLNLLHVIITTLHLVGIIIQILLTTPNLLLIERGIDPDLIGQHTFIFSVLNISHLHRRLPDVLRVALQCLLH